jgi:hypothetical protein
MKDEQGRDKKFTLSFYNRPAHLSRSFGLHET